MENVLVTGGSGFIGHAVVRSLLQAGFRVRVLTRQALPTLPEHPLLEHRQGDMTDAQSLQKACTGIDRVVHLAARKSDENDSVAVNVEGARKLRDACEKAGVKQIINLSTQSAKLSTRGTYGETKKQADEILSASPIPVLTLRSSLVYGGDASGVFQTILRYAKLPVIPVIGNGRYRFRPIHRDDLASTITHAALQLPRSGMYDAGGPDLVSFDDLVRRILALKNVRKPLLHLPIWMALLIAKLPRSPLTRSNVLGSAEDVPMAIELFLRDFPVPLRTLEQGLREALEEPVKSATTEEVLNEALFLLRYVRSANGRWKPMQEDGERYRMALDVHGISETPTLTRRGRRWIGGLDTHTRLKYPQCVLQQKLLVACAIAECHPASAKALLPRKRLFLTLLLQTVWFGLRSAAKLIGAHTLRLFPSFVKHHAG